MRFFDVDDFRRRPPCQAYCLTAADIGWLSFEQLRADSDTRSATLGGRSAIHNNSCRPDHHRANCGGAGLLPIARNQANRAGKNRSRKEEVRARGETLPCGGGAAPQVI